jgi:hypothetical protein
MSYRALQKHIEDVLVNAVRLRQPQFTISWDGTSMEVKTEIAEILKRDHGVNMVEEIINIFKCEEADKLVVKFDVVDDLSHIYTPQMAQLIEYVREKAIEEYRAEMFPKQELRPEEGCEHSWYTSLSCSSYFTRKCYHCGKEETIDKD